MKELFYFNLSSLRNGAKFRFVDSDLLGKETYKKVNYDPNTRMYEVEMVSTGVRIKFTTNHLVKPNYVG